MPTLRVKKSPNCNSLHVGNEKLLLIYMYLMQGCSGVEVLNAGHSKTGLSMKYILFILLYQPLSIGRYVCNETKQTIVFNLFFIYALL